MNKGRLIVVLSALVVLSVGWVVVDRFSKSVRCTYYQLRTAARKHDWDLFVKYVNLKSLEDYWQNDEVSIRLERFQDENFVTTYKSDCALPPSFPQSLFLTRLKQTITSGVADTCILPELFSLDTAEVLKVDTDEIDIRSRYGILGVPARVRLEMRYQNGRYILQGLDRSELLHRNEIMLSALRRWATRHTEEEILKNVSIRLVDFVNDKPRILIKYSEDRIYYERKVNILRKMENHSSKDVLKLVYDVCPDWWLNNKYCVRFVDGKIGSNKSLSSWISVVYIPNVIFPDMKTPDTISNLPVRRRRIIPIKLIFANGDSIAVDQCEYLNRKQPSWQELVAFMKHDSLQYADSIEMWYKGLR